MFARYQRFAVAFTAAAFLAISIAPASAETPSITTPQIQYTYIRGSFKVPLMLPKAKPTAILTFCDGQPFEGAWVEDEGRKMMGKMYNQRVDGRGYRFTVQVGPGVWNFVVMLEGNALNGTVTGDGATSTFEGQKVILAKAYCP